MRYAVLTITLICCLLGIGMAGQAGVSRLLINRGLAADLSISVDEAVYLSPSDPKVRYARAAALWRKGDVAGATKEFENAVALRPRDYVSWLNLANARDTNGDREGALTAIRQAVQLAPYYAQPRWHLGKLLLDLGQYDAAFSEFRRAAESDPTLLPDIIDLAWHLHPGDASAVRRTIQPATAASKIELTRFFIKQGELTQAVELFRETDGSDHIRRMLLTELLKAARFSEAYDVWSRGRVATDRSSNSGAHITNNSFEQIVNATDDRGFGWVLIGQGKGVRISQDADQPFAGEQSLQLDFNGNAPEQIGSQLALVEPHTRYRLKFASRTEELLTGGLPMVLVSEASGNRQELGRSVLLPGNNGWQHSAVDFLTGEASGAVLIIIKRTACGNSQPCPIFGRVWFDDFSLQKL